MLICDVNLNAVWKLTRVRVLSKVSTMGKVCVCCPVSAECGL